MKQKSKPNIKMKFRFYLDELVKQHETQSDLVAELEYQEEKKIKEKKKIKDAVNTLVIDEWSLGKLVKQHGDRVGLLAKLEDHEKKNKEEKKNNEEKKKIKEAKMELIEIKKAISAKKRKIEIQSDLVAKLGGQETLSDLVAELKDQGKKIKEAKMELLKIKKAISTKKTRSHICKVINRTAAHPHERIPKDAPLSSTYPNQTTRSSTV